MSNGTQALTLAAFLEARLAEDEWAARVFVNELGEARHWRADEVGPIVRRLGPSPFGLSDVQATCATHLEAVHIARHDPARVLAECAAKRAIVAQWDMTQPPASGADYAIEQELELALCHLAAIYADHSDYDPAWAVS